MNSGLDAELVHQDVDRHLTPAGQLTQASDAKDVGSFQPVRRGDELGVLASRQFLVLSFVDKLLIALPLSSGKPSVDLREKLFVGELLRRRLRSTQMLSEQIQNEAIGVEAAEACRVTELMLKVGLDIKSENHASILYRRSGGYAAFGATAASGLGHRHVLRHSRAVPRNGWRPAEDRCLALRLRIGAWHQLRRGHPTSQHSLEPVLQPEVTRPGCRSVGPRSSRHLQWQRSVAPVVHRSIYRPIRGSIPFSSEGIQSQ